MVVSNKNKILEILKENSLSILEISEKIKFVGDERNNVNNVRTYVHRLLDEGLIVETGEKKDGFVVYSFNKENRKSINVVENNDLEKKCLKMKNMLNFLNSFFVNNVDYLIKNKKIDAFIEENESAFNEISEVLKNGK